MRSSPPIPTGILAPNPDVSPPKQTPTAGWGSPWTWLIALGLSALPVLAWTTLGPAEAALALCVQTIGIVACVHNARAEHSTTNMNAPISSDAAEPQQLFALAQDTATIARLAGRAEVASTVLHDVGNALTAANVGVALVRRRLHNQRPAQLGRVADALRAGPDMAPEIRDRLALYLDTAQASLASERQSLTEEMNAVNEAIEHVASIVHLQQQHARAPDLAEAIDLSTLLGHLATSLKASFVAENVRCLHSLPTLPPVLLNRHRVLQILTTLLTNAREAVADGHILQPCVRIDVDVIDDTLVFDVRDNGPGIPLALRTQVFQHGFTTKVAGNGVGLHSSANVARTMDGQLSLMPSTAEEGAWFRLSLPLKIPAENGASPNDVTAGSRKW